VGVPSDYSWYNGKDQGTVAPPSDFTSVGGWAQVYREQGSTYSNPNATIDVANSQTYVHLKATNQWVLVENQSSDPIQGGHFVTDFAGNAAIGMTVTNNSDGTATMSTPPSGYNDHFWHAGRGQFAAGAVDAVYVQMDMKISDPSMKVVANIGADWWPTPTTDFVDGFANNPGAGMSNWVALSGQYKTLAFFSGSTAQFQADPPPSVTGAVATDPKPPVVTDPSTGSGTPVVSNPTTPPADPKPPVATDPSTGSGTPVVSNPTTPPADQTGGTNLLKNGSFESTALGQGQADAYGRVDGWTALSGSKIELWNNVDGVKATNGGNFSELDYEGATDGFSQSVKTAAGKAYTFSIDARDRPNTNPNSCGIEVVWNGKVVSTIMPGADWKTFTVGVTGTGGNDTLTIREPSNQSSDGVGALIDNLGLVAKTSSVSNAASSTTAEKAPATTDPTLAATDSTTTKASTPTTEATAGVAASTNGSHPFQVGNPTLAFAADKASAPSASDVQSGGLALFRQQVASTFVDAGASSAATPIHDQAAATWSQTLAQPRHN
jgi:hypothetical protein